MKKMLLGICATMYLIPLVAQNKPVIIADKQTRQPIASASLEFSNGSGSTSNEHGILLLSTQKGKATISSIGYRTIQLNFPVSLDTIFLQPINLFLDPVEVTALRAGDRAPFALTNLKTKDLAKQNLGQDLTFLLNQTPSVVVSSDAGNGVGYTGIRIRGSDATRINMTLNGIPYNDAESQGLFLVNLPDFASSVESIQIQRGVGTSSNGGGAFGATLNLSTNEFREEKYAEINNSFGSFNTWKNTVKLGSGLIGDHFTIDARLSRISSDGYIDRASTNLQSFYVSGAYITEKSSLRLNIFSGKEKTYQAWNGILQSEANGPNRRYNSAGTEKPGSPYKNETDNYKQDHYQLFFNHSLSDRISFNSAAFLTRGRGYYEQYKADEDYADYGLDYPVINGSPVSSTDLIRQLWLDNYFYGGIYSAQYKNKGTQVTLGGAIVQYDGDHYGKIIWSELGIAPEHQWYQNQARKSDINFYGKWTQSINSNWQSFLDLQYRTVDYRISGFRNNPGLSTDNRYHFFNPKVGISYTNQAWNAFASFAIGNKEPNRDDFEAGVSQQPKPERLNDFEIGFEHKKSRSSLGATFYYMAYRNQLVLTGRINDVGAYARTNIDNSYRMGIELQGSYKVANWITVLGNLTLSENKVLDFEEFFDDYDEGTQKSVQYEKTTISFSPAIMGSASAVITPFKNAEIALIGKYVGSQYLDNTSNNNRQLPAFYTQDLRLSYTVKGKAIKDLTLIFQLNNLFDKPYEPNGYTFSYIYDQRFTTENYVYPMAGINCMGGVNIRL
ncbi:TonB-dependent receptor [Flavihumibacter sp. UBA7668]|uniref:TonB-dependent receptor n=1 Tax=Flavihumibacter sp. UBA7668 TaxID=1946542 RepID=UPI0025C6BD50|nr:TonB-dependent receptor [Flavihumibacter sp. UBA7668]